MPRFDRLITTTVALAMAGAVSLSGCTATKDAATDASNAAKEAATDAGNAAKDAASSAGKASLATAINPVLDLLNKSQGEVKAGNLAAAVAGMGGFQALWNTASPVIQPLAGDKWPIIDTAAKLALSTFAPGAKPTAANAGSALTGLIGPLSALLK